MNQIQIVLQISLSIISLLQLLLAGFALLLDPRNRCNRYLAAHLTLLSVIAFSSSRLSAATDVSQASVWFHILGGATVAVGPALLIVTLSLLRPDDWRPNRIERWVWRLAHILLALPIVLALSDAVFDANWFVTGLDPQTYSGGFATTNAYARGNFARILIPINLYLLSSAPLLFIVYTLWRRRPGAPVIQTRARWLLVAQVGMMIIQLGLIGRVNNLATTTMTDVLVVIVYTALILRGLVSDAALTQALANVRLRPKLSISVGAALLGLMIISSITIYASVSLQNQVTETLNRQQELADLTTAINPVEEQQAKLSTAIESFEARRTSSIITVIGLALLTLFTSATAAYFVAGKVIQPLRELGQTADCLGSGDLSVRAVVHGQDEIGKTAYAFNVMADRLVDLLAGLEQQVADRTRDLTRRTGYLEASVEVGRAASSILETDELVGQVVEMIRDQFDLYYVGLFLLDSDREWAVLRAGTGPAGHAMLARGHRIAVGQGMIGWSIANASPRVAAEASGDVVRLATEELPDTRSEAAVPLRSRGQILGAVSVQATRADAFDDAAISALQSMADQVAVALDNARLYSASQEALETARRAYGELGREHWADLTRQRAALGIRADDRGTATIAPDEPWPKEIIRAIHSGEAVSNEGLVGAPSSATDGAERHPLVIPIEAHGQIIGVIDTYKLADNGGWTADELEMVHNIIAQLALALDNARLHQETQRRAVREQLAREITEKVRAAPDVESIAAIAAEELVKALGGSRGFVRLHTNDGNAQKRDGQNGRDDSLRT